MYVGIIVKLQIGINDPEAVGKLVRLSVHRCAQINVNVKALAFGALEF